MIKHALNPEHLESDVVVTGLLECLDTLPNPAFIKNREGVYLFVNKELESFWEKAKEEVIGKADLDFLPFSEASDCNKSDQKAWQNPTGITTSYETQNCEYNRKVKRYITINKRITQTSLGEFLIGLVNVLEV